MIPAIQQCLARVDELDERLLAQQELLQRCQLEANREVLAELRLQVALGPLGAAAPFPAELWPAGRTGPPPPSRFIQPSTTTHLCSATQASWSILC